MADAQVTTPAAPAAGEGEVNKAPVDGKPVDTKVEDKKAEAVRKHKLKVFGKEEEWDEENVLRFAQKGRAYEREMQESKQRQKLTEKAQKEFEELFKQNKRLALEKTIGRDALREAAIELLKEEIEDEQDPKSKEARQLRRELEELKRQKAKDEAEKESAKTEEEVAKWRQAYDEEFTEALSQTKLRKHPAVVKRMAELQMKNLKGNHNVPLGKIAKMVEKEFFGDIQEYAKNLSPDEFDSVFGEEFGEKYSQHRVSKLRSPTPKKGEPKQEVRKPEDTGPLSIDEWHKRLEEKLK